MKNIQLLIGGFLVSGMITATCCSAPAQEYAWDPSPAQAIFDKYTEWLLVTNGMHFGIMQKPTGIGSSVVSVVVKPIKKLAKPGVPTKYYVVRQNPEFNLWVSSENGDLIGRYTTGEVFPEKQTKFNLMKAIGLNHTEYTPVAANIDIREFVDIQEGGTYKIEIEVFVYERFGRSTGLKRIKLPKLERELYIKPE